MSGVGFADADSKSTCAIVGAVHCPINSWKCPNRDSRSMQSATGQATSAADSRMCNKQELAVFWWRSGCAESYLGRSQKGGFGLVCRDQDTNKGETSREAASV